MKSILGSVPLVALASILVLTNASPTPMQVESQIDMAMAFSAASEPDCVDMCAKEPPPCWDIYLPDWVSLPQSVNLLLSSC
jgi:hypothetical protein